MLRCTSLLRSHPARIAHGATIPTSPFRSRQRPSSSTLVVQAQQQQEDKKLVTDIEDTLKKSGVDKKVATDILNKWKEMAGPNETLSPENFRKIMSKQSSKAITLVILQLLLDIGAAYGAFLAGNLLGDAAISQDWGVAATFGQAIAYFLSGYYVTGAAIDVFKLIALGIAAVTFNVNAPAFLAAVEDLASTNNTGLGALDKASEAVNTVKILAALRDMSDMLKKETNVDAAASSADILNDLAAYLTLDKAQRMYKFDAAKAGITDAQAADIAVIFSAYDSNDDGVLQLDEFKKMCGKYAPDLSDVEVEAGLKILDKDGSGNISFGEFVDWWLKKV